MLEGQQTMETDRTAEADSTVERVAVRPGAEWDGTTLTAAERETLAGHHGGVVWFTGLSGSGKTTVAQHLDRRLHAAGKRSFLLDGDVMRDGITKGLGFGREDREENLRRFTEVAHLFAEAGMIALVSAIAPYEDARERARHRIGPKRFVLIHVNTPLAVCESRDPKGLYKAARRGAIPEFTGISSPYEDPVAADLRLRPEDGDPQAQADLVWRVLEGRGLLTL
jgi:adenylyl-sulfate kinase